MKDTFNINYSPKFDFEKIYYNLIERKSEEEFLEFLDSLDESTYFYCCEFIFELSDEEFAVHHDFDKGNLLKNDKFRYIHTILSKNSNINFQSVQLLGHSLGLI